MRSNGANRRLSSGLAIIPMLVLAGTAGGQVAPKSQAYPQQFVGIWKSPDPEHSTLVLNLHEEGVQLAGTLAVATPAAGGSAAPPKIAGAKISGPYLLFEGPDEHGTAAQWRMEVMNPGVGLLQRMEVPGSNPISIARETIFGLTTAPGPNVHVDTPADLQQFAGEWKTEHASRAFITLVLREQGGKLVGSCRHSRSINWDKHGELTLVSEELTEDDVLSASTLGKTLSLVIANAEDPDTPVKIALTLTSADQAQGVLLDLPSDVPRQKPWLFQRTSQ